jgi:hypothetical protein
MGAIRDLARSGRAFEVTWRYLFNFAPTLTYKVGRSPLSTEAYSVLTNLNRDGVAITFASSLFGSDTCFEDLFKAFSDLRHSQSAALSEARANATANAIVKKNFIYEYLGHNPVLNPHEVYARFALHDRILQIANAYLGMYTRLRYFNIWHTFAKSGPPRQSQLWHRDREDRYILKVFAYLSDVDEGAGPFTYAAGTHAKGNIRRTPEFFLEGGVQRTTDDQMARVVPTDQWIKAKGVRGTIVFADTRGYHKGGLATDRDRVMYTCMFTSPASESEEFLRRPARIETQSSREKAFALAPPKRGLWLSLKRPSQEIVRL